MPSGGNIIQSGGVTPSHLASWTADGILQDAGVPISSVYGLPPITIAAGGTYNLPVGSYGDILVSTTAALTINLPDSTFRNGVPVSIVDISGAPAVSIVPNGTQKIISLARFPFITPWGGLTFWPLSGSGGWYQK